MSFGLPAGAAPPAPGCYRHPDRETGIHCTRCGRPICPECMRSATVGYQCPECVAAGAATVRATRTTFGGRVPAKPGIATYTIIGLCTALNLAVGELGMLGGVARWGMQPAAIAINDEWYRLLSSVFVHAGWLHLAFNMYMLFLLGPPLEAVLGRARFVTLYLVSGLGGAVASYAFSSVMTLSVGASGAIFGLMAGWVVVSRRLERDASQVLVLLAINVALGFVMAGVDWRAHLGGALTGALAALALTHGQRSGAVPVARQVLGIAVILLVLGTVVVVRTDQIRALIVGGGS